MKGLRILFISIVGVDMSQSGIYSDLVRALLQKGHQVTLLNGRKFGGESSLPASFIELHFGLSVFNIRNRYLRGAAALFAERIIRHTIRKNLAGSQFDLLLYATPPVNYCSVLKYCKKKFGTINYLMLKDIFPQNAVDEGLIRGSGLLYRYLRRKEKRLYRFSDHIGCMSRGNIEYLLRNNPEISSDKTELFPNSIWVPPVSQNFKSKGIRKKYAIPEDGVAFVFGGNLGIAQGLDFLVECIASLNEESRAYFLVVGGGALTGFVEEQLRPLGNARFIPMLPKDDYDDLLAECDVGLISLGGSYTVPNYPSRILSYMQASLPILAVTDRVTDLRALLENEACCGLWSSAGDFKGFCDNVRSLCENKDCRIRMGRSGRAYLEKHFDVIKAAEILESHYQARLEEDRCLNQKPCS